MTTPISLPPPEGRASERRGDHQFGLIRSEGLNIEFRQSQPTGAGFGYRATIDGVNVYMINLPSDQAWLFSGRMLRSIRYARLESGNLVDLLFNEADDPHESSFTVHFAQEVEWNDLPIIELVLQSRPARKAQSRQERQSLKRI